MGLNRLATSLVAVALIGGAAWWAWNSTRDEVSVIGSIPEPPTNSPAAETSIPADASDAPAPADASRASVAAVDPSPVAKTESAPPPPEDVLVAQVQARLVDTNGVPLSGVRFAALGSKYEPKWVPAPPELSDANGRVLLKLELPLRKFSVGLAQHELPVDFLATRTGLGSIARSASLCAGETKNLGNIMMVPGGQIMGRVVDTDGVGIEGAEVGVAPTELPGDLERAVRHGGAFLQTVPRTKSNVGGAFLLEGIPIGKLRAWAHKQGFRYTWTEPIVLSDQGELPDVLLTLRRLADSDTITGRVLAPDGTPLRGANLWAEQHSRGVGTGGPESVDAEGRFEIMVEHDDSTYDLRGDDIMDRYGATTLKGVLPGARDLEIRLQLKEQWAVHVRDPDAKPVLDASFNISTQGSQQYPATSSAPGNYSIAKPTEPFVLFCVAKGFRTTRVGTGRAPLLPAAIPDPLGVVLIPAKLLRGRVTANGAPVAGARVFDARDDPAAISTAAGYRYRYWVGIFGPDGLRTDAEGRFELDCDYDGKFWLRVTAEGWAASELGPIDAAQLDARTEFEIELTRGGAIEGRVLLADGADASGALVAFNHGDSCPFVLRAGAGGVFRAAGLSVGHWQVLPATSEIGTHVGFPYASIETDQPIPWSCEVRDGETTHFDLDLTRK